jgi:hypothetical protein
MNKTQNNNPFSDFNYLDNVLDTMCAAVCRAAQMWSGVDEMGVLDKEVMDAAAYALANLSFAGLLKLGEVSALSAFATNGATDEYSDFMSYTMKQATEIINGEEDEENEVPTTNDTKTVSLLESCLMLDSQN